MASDLDRQRLKGNIIDEVEALRRELREMKEQMVTADQQGVIRGAGLLLRVRDKAPAAPRPGFVVVYAQEEDGDTYLRGIDELGVVRDLANWSEDGQDVRVRHVGTGEWWRLFIDEGAGGEDQFYWEAI